MARRRWTRELIIQELRDLHTAGEPLTTRSMHRLGYGGMVAAAYREDGLGSWQAALEAAGLADQHPTARQRKWTAARIVARIKQLHAQGAELSYSAVKREHQYLLVVARSPRNFGSWRAAVQAAGLDYEQICRK